MGVPAHGQSGARGEHLGSGLSALELARPSDDRFDLDLTGFDEEEPGRMPAGTGGSANVGSISSVSSSGRVWSMSGPRGCRSSGS